MMNRREFTRRLALGMAVGLMPWQRMMADEFPGNYPRWVALNWAHAATGTALGFPPIAVTDKRGYENWVRQPALPSWTRSLGSRFTPNLEALKRLRPELIVSTNYFSAMCPPLDHVAPILNLDIYTPERRPYENSVVAAQTLAERLGNPQAAQTLIETTEHQIEKANQRLGAGLSRPLLFLQILDPTHVRAFGGGSLFQSVLDRLPLENAWTQDTNYWGFASIGIEAVAAVKDAYLTTSKPLSRSIRNALDRSAIWLNLPSLRDQSIVELPPVNLHGELSAAGRFAQLLGDAFAQDARSSEVDA